MRQHLTRPHRAASLARPVPEASLVLLDLPFPPSANELWRSNRGRVHKGAVYTVWLEQADRLCMALRQRPLGRVTGDFQATIILDYRMRKRGADLDNRIKPLLDYAQSRKFIRNDNGCVRVVASWGEAPHGARLLIEAVTVKPCDLTAQVATFGADSLLPV